MDSFYSFENSEKKMENIYLLVHILSVSTPRVDRGFFRSLWSRMGAAVGEGEMAWGYDDKFFFFSAKNSYVWLKLSVHPPPPWDRHRQKGPIIVLCQKKK